jgi:hypothetical protein
MPDPHPHPSAKYDSKISATPKQADARGISTLARLYWMLVGNGILVLLALAITQDRHQRALTTDAAFWAVVASLLVVRYLDVARLGGKTASGEPASLGDWFRYSRRLLLIAAVAWIVVRAIPLVGLWLVPAS